MINATISLATITIFEMYLESVVIFAFAHWFIFIFCSKINLESLLALNAVIPIPINAAIGTTARPFAGI